MRKLFVLFAVSTGLLVSACNTVDGMGEDLQSASDTVEDEL